MTIRKRSYIPPLRKTWSRHIEKLYKTAEIKLYLNSIRAEGFADTGLILLEHFDARQYSIAECETMSFHAFIPNI